MIEPQRFEAERRQAEKVAFAGFIVLVIIVLYAAVSKADDTALWLARSCIGEAGWDSAESGECAAIMHIYRKRSDMGPHPIVTIAKKYSAAIKPRQQRRNPWVLDLDRELAKPKRWPSKSARWGKYRPRWAAMLSLADNFLLGIVDDPLPAAMHYGGKFERRRAINAGWKRVKAPQFRNAFWRVK